MQKSAAGGDAAWQGAIYLVYGATGCYRCYSNLLHRLTRYIRPSAPFLPPKEVASEAAKKGLSVAIAGQLAVPPSRHVSKPRPM